MQEERKARYEARILKLERAEKNIKDEDVAGIKKEGRTRKLNAKHYKVEYNEIQPTLDAFESLCKRIGNMQRVIVDNSEAHTLKAYITFWHKRQIYSNDWMDITQGNTKARALISTLCRPTVTIRKYMKANYGKYTIWRFKREEYTRRGISFNKLEGGDILMEHGLEDLEDWDIDGIGSRFPVRNYEVPMEEIEIQRLKEEDNNKIVKREWEEDIIEKNEIDSVNRIISVSSRRSVNRISMKTVSDSESEKNIEIMDNNKEAEELRSKLDVLESSHVRLREAFGSAYGEGALTAAMEGVFLGPMVIRLHKAHHGLLPSGRDVATQTQQSGTLLF